jgi:hypothetical protein
LAIALGLLRLADAARDADKQQHPQPTHQLFFS